MGAGAIRVYFVSFRFFLGYANYNEKQRKNERKKEMIYQQPYFTLA